MFVEFERVQRLAVQRFRHMQIDDVVAVAEAQVITHQRVVQHLRDMLADVLFRVYDPVGTELGQDPVVGAAQRLGPDHVHAQQLDVHCA